MNKVENVTRSRVATPEEQSLFIKQAKQNGAELMKLQLSQALVQALTSTIGDPDSKSSSPIGTTSSALTAGGATRIPNADKMPFFDQGDSNACATTSLSMVFEYFGIHLSREEIDKAIRRGDNFLGSSVDDILEFARDHGLEAEGYNNGTWEEVKNMIDQGYPVLASVDSDDNIEGVDTSDPNKSWELPDGRHVITITGYGTDPATGEEYVLYHDPNYGDDPTTSTKEGGELRMSVSDFKKAWGKETFGVKNYFMAFGPEGADLPAGRDDGAEGALGVHAGATNISNGFDRIFSPDSFGSFVHGIPQFFGGIVQTVGSGVGALFQLGSSWLHGAVEGIPVLENIVQPFADVFNGIGAGIADIFNGFGEACDSIGGAFESLFDGDLGGFVEGVGEAVGDVVGGVVDAVGDVGEAIVDGIGDIFSGW
ncbi:MAG: C39 family peptidase [Acidobacteria bacterium]|nr:C39 family peptidase [Acidobacteriota bacterium]MCI0720975.1 C39 family peptidase [Acidobacteriota bacterium]